MFLGCLISPFGPVFSAFPGQERIRGGKVARPACIGADGIQGQPRFLGSVLVRAADIWWFPKMVRTPVHPPFSWEFSMKSSICGVFFMEPPTSPKRPKNDPWVRQKRQNGHPFHLFGSARNTRSSSELGDKPCEERRSRGSRRPEK